MKSFIGNSTQYKARNLEILSNLTCPKLQDFRWYKDVFLTKVMYRTDCNNAYWKERFIAGLPRLFAEKVRTKLNEEYDNDIPYRNLTYGDLINYINMEGLAICSD